MAYNQFDVPAETIALVASTAKTVVGLKAAANVCVKLTETLVSFDGSTSSNTPAVCELNQCTFATQPPGTASTSVTPSKRDTGRAETVQATAAKNWTTQPTVLAVQRCYDIGQYNGVYHNIFAFASPFIVIGAQGVAITITSPNNVNSSNFLTAEE